MTDTHLYDVIWKFGMGYPNLPDGTTTESSGAHWILGRAVGVTVRAATAGEACDLAEKTVVIPGINFNDLPVTIRRSAA